MSKYLSEISLALFCAVLGIVLIMIVLQLWNQFVKSARAKKTGREAREILRSLMHRYAGHEPITRIEEKADPSLMVAVLEELKRGLASLEYSIVDRTLIVGFDDPTSESGRTVIAFQLDNTLTTFYYHAHFEMLCDSLGIQTKGFRRARK